MLHLPNLNFEIESAELWAVLPDPYWCDTYNQGAGKELHWGIDIWTRKVDAGDQIWAPYLYNHHLYFPVKNWLDLPGQVVRWASPVNPDSGESNGCCCVWQHGDINKAELRIVNRSGVDFHLEWEGVCDMYWDETYGENVPFSIHAVAHFSGVSASCSEYDSIETVRDRLALYLHPDDFVQEKMETAGHTYSSGIGIVSCKFLPKV